MGRYLWGEELISDVQRMIIYEGVDFSFLLQHRYQMMTRCWADNPDARPTFTELCQDLEDWMQRDTPYLHMDQLDEDQPYYNASAISASSGSLCKEPASESHDSNTTAENLACDDNTVF